MRRSTLLYAGLCCFIMAAALFNALALLSLSARWGQEAALLDAAEAENIKLTKQLTEELNRSAEREREVAAVLAISRQRVEETQQRLRALAEAGPAQLERPSVATGRRPPGRVAAHGPRAVEGGGPAPLERPPDTAGLRAPDVVAPRGPASEAGRRAGSAVPLGGGAFFEGRTPVLLLCYSRPEYLRRTFRSLLSVLPAELSAAQRGDLPIFVSQDGDDAGVVRVVQEFVGAAAKLGYGATHLRHPRAPGRLRGGAGAYAALSEHYRWALAQIFAPRASRRAIILEDDLELAPDLFEYFAALAPRLDADESLMAVSAWNDHGQAAYVSDARALYRTDVFPGLGWMLTRKLYEELAPKWPQAYWDDWLRDPAQRLGRTFVRPEVSRTITFGKSGGASAGQFFDKFLAPMRLNDEVVPFRSMDLGYLDKGRYEEALRARVRAARAVSAAELRRREDWGGADLKIEYAGNEGFKRVARGLGMMDDIKADCPRGSFSGVLPFHYRGARVFIAPTGWGVR